jgi:hypothetical protein
MVLNEDPKQQIIKSFSKRKTITGILLYAALACFALVIFSLRHPDPTLTGLPSNLELGLGLGFGVGLLIIVFFLWRCPACNKFIGLRTNSKVCPHCKAGLEPDWTQTKDKPVMALFKKKKKTMYILGAIIVVGFIPMFIADNNPESKIALISVIVAVVIDFGIFISMFIIWRCPNCNSYLGNSMNPSNCPKCDVRLRM